MDAERDRLHPQFEAQRQTAEPRAQRLEARLGPAKPAKDMPPAGLQRFIGGKLLSSAWFTRHVVLDRSLAVAGHYPAVDALGSISRVARSRPGTGCGPGLNALDCQTSRDPVPWYQPSR